MSPQAAIGFVWIASLLSWAAAAFWRSPTVKRPAGSEDFVSRLIVTLGAFLMFWRYNLAPGIGVAGWALLGIQIAGIAFAWWARLHLGRLWSGRIVRKEGHRIVDTGPYALVRHPIYTGIITAALTTGIAEGRVLALAGAVILGIGFSIRGRLEERFLRQELGEEAYDSYARRVPMLIPFTGRTR